MGGSNIPIAAFPRAGRPSADSGRDGGRTPLALFAAVSLLRGSLQEATRVQQGYLADARPPGARPTRSVPRCDHTCARTAGAVGLAQSSSAARAARGFLWGSQSQSLRADRLGAAVGPAPLLPAASATPGSPHWPGSRASPTSTRLPHAPRARPGRPLTAAAPETHSAGNTDNSVPVL